MIHLINLTLLGLFGGTIALLWTRIIRKGMIFHFLGKKLSRIDDRYRIAHSKPHPWVKFILCSYCLSPWICGLFDLWYILTYNVGFIPAVVGILASYGAGNLAIEFVLPLRNE